MSKACKLTVAYDCTFLGLGYINPKSRTGIYRVVQDGLLALLNQPSINLNLSSIGDKNSAWNETASKLCLRTLNLNLEDKLIASYPSWVHSSLSLPIKFQKKIIENSFQSFPLLYKGGLALQIPIDSLTQNSKKHLAHPNFDVYHSSFLALPSILSNLNIPRILTVHDLIPILFPQFCTQRTLDRFKEILSSINPEKDWIICVSEATKNDFCEYIKIDPARVFVVPNAASKYFQRADSDRKIDAVINRYGLAKNSYLLSLSTIE
ncbi:MAG TPA: glycosyltransferase, partial [Phormidium sp.]